MIMHVNREGIQSGLYGYNGILVGAALATFFEPSLLLWAYLIFVQRPPRSSCSR
jgi:urea transporter